jgi:hypothetical protein
MLVLRLLRLDRVFAFLGSNFPHCIRGNVRR